MKDKKRSAGCGIMVVIVRETMGLTLYISSPIIWVLDCPSVVGYLFSYSRITTRCLWILLCTLIRSSAEFPVL